MPDFWMPLTTEPMIASTASRLKNPRLAWLSLIGGSVWKRNRKTLKQSSTSSCTSGWRVMRQI